MNECLYNFTEFNSWELEMKHVSSDRATERENFAHICTRVQNGPIQFLNLTFCVFTSGSTGSVDLGDPVMFGLLPTRSAN